MSCIPINHTPEEIRNIFINKGLLWRTSKDDTSEDVVARYEYIRRVMKLPPGEDQRYNILGWDVKERVSNEFAKKSREARIGKTRVAREDKKPDNIKKRNAGIKMHQILADIMNSLIENKDLKDVRIAAGKGDYSLNVYQFNQLVNVAKEVKAEIEKIQKSIDDTKEATILVEQPIIDPIHNRGGTMDISAIFSDKSQAIFDYKVIMSTTGSIMSNYDYTSGQLTNDLLGIDRITDYSLNMGEYARISKEIFNAGQIRELRLVPIHIRLQFKNQKEWGEFDQLTTNVDLIQAGTKNISNEFLKPIPLSGESTGYKGIDELLEKQWILINRLSKELSSKKTSAADKERLRKRVAVLRKSIQRSIVDGDISDIINSAIMVVNEFNARKDEKELLEDGSRNSKYLVDDDLQEFIGELSMYKDIIDNTHKYYDDLKESDPEGYERLRSTIYDLTGEVTEALANIKEENEKRITELVLGKYLHKDRDGNLLPLEELPFFSRNMTRFSDIDHPFFKAGWELIQKSYFNIRRDVKEMAEEITETEKKLFTWAKANNMKRLDALGMLVDRTTGNMVNELSRELIRKIGDAFSTYEVDEAYKKLNEIYEIRDKEEFLESYNQRYERFRDTEVHKYKDGENDPKFKKALLSWVNSYDLINSKAAWSNKSNKGWLRIKESVREANQSEEFKKIKNIKPLYDYYMMYVKYNNIFRKMLDVDQYDDLPPNFIANIRKSMIDHLSMDKLAVVSAVKELADSFHVREEDTFMSDVDETGDVKRNIPVLFMNPFISENGEIDNNKKSYDLSKNLMLFGKMAFNYKYMHEIEPKILQLRAAMSTPSAEMPGTTVTNKWGQEFKGYIKEKATKKGLDTDTYKLFEEMTDAYLYGIKFKDNNFKNKGVDFTKLILKLKQYYGKSTLAFAVIPGAAAYVAGNISEMLESKKGISFNSKQLRQSWYHLATNFKKYRSIALYFDVYAEDPTTVLIENKSANFLSRLFTYRNLMYPLRKTDENINDSILNAMALNWGIDTEGKFGKKNALIRLNRRDIDTTGLRSIWELAKLDENTGRMYIEGITDENGKIVSEEAYIAFRNAVRATSANVIGSLSQEDLFRGDTNLLYNVMFQFKSWMLGIGRERTGKLTYDEKLQAARWGRFRAAASEFGLVDTDYDTGFKIRHYISSVFLPNVAKLALDLSTFGIVPRVGLFMDTYTDDLGRVHKTRTNIARARRMYIKYMMENKWLENQMSFDQFLEVKEAQMKAALVEVRTIVMFLIAIHLMGAGGGDDKNPPPYIANWFSRFIYKNLTKAQSELTFMWSPAQLFNMMRNPFPMTGLLTRTLSTAMNGFDEIRDWMIGENSLSDKTPFPYYGIQWVYGGGQIARLIELYKQYQKSPYLVNPTGR